MSKTKTIIVFYNGNGLSVDQEVADLKGLKNGYRIRSEAEFWDILSSSCNHGLQRLQLTKPVWNKDDKTLNN